MTHALRSPPPIFVNPLRRLFDDEPVFTGMALLLAIAMVPTLTAMALDARQIGFENVWIKPLKFQVALCVYLMTLAFYARWLPQGMTNRIGYRLYSWAIVLSVLGETLWIGGAAANGAASHFNVSTPLMGALYSLMGVLAVILTSASLTYGIAIWRYQDTGLNRPMRLSLSLGLTLTFALTVPVAGYLAGTSGPFVGTPVTHASLPIVGWSSEVGDLRIAHFFATHAMHFVPAIAWAVRASSPVAWLTALGFTAFTLATFVQALAGQPLLGVFQ